MHAVNEPNPPSRTEAVQPAPARMHAATHRRYGPPAAVLGYEQVAHPGAPAEGELLVRVHAACASIGDHHVIAGKPYPIRLTPFGGLPRPKHLVPGQAMAGRVEALGAKVGGFRVGDEVFGEVTRGAFAEYLRVPATLVAHKPTNLSFEQAAAVPWAAAALQGLRDVAKLAPGQHLLINGASGGVGTWAVQLGKALGAEVTAVCSTRHLALMRSLGADEVIDYTAQDFSVGGARFDVLLDLVGNRSLSECRRVLRPHGVYVSSSGRGNDWFGPMFRLLQVFLTSLFTSQRLTTVFAMPTQQDLLFLKQLIEAGKAKPVIERIYTLSQAGEALAHVGQGHSQGQSVLRITS